MLYSKKIEGDFRALARDVFNQAMSYCQTPEEINSFCHLLDALLKKDINYQDTASIENCAQSTNTENFYANPSIKTQIAHLLELVSHEGFEVYVTNDIINFHNSGLMAFTSSRSTSDKAEVLAEAKTEFIAVLKNEFQNQLTRIFNLSHDQKLEKINDIFQDKKQTQINQ